MVEDSDQEMAQLDLELRSIGRSSKVAVKRTTMARVSSFQTKAFFQELNGTPTKTCEVAERLLTVFRRHEDAMVQQYFWSQDFAQDFLCLCEYTKAVLRKESKLLELKGPLHVFGDIHGNLEDLFFFREKLWPTGMELTAGKFLFLGDYVDRGMQGLEVLTYLFASKVCTTRKLYMLRGNHELRYVNGWEDHYKERSFLWQCKDRFGDKVGEKVWRAANTVFDCLPLAATIDGSVFCSHGGIPRQREGFECFREDEDTRLADITSLPAAMKITPLRLKSDAEDSDTPLDEHYTELEPWQTTLSMDLLWGDPCPSNEENVQCYNDQENEALDDRGFGPGQRGGAAIMFGQRAVDEFFANNSFSIMLRAHQASTAGISVTKRGRVVTVFSTSKDHALGDASTCAYTLVEDGKVIAVNRIVEEMPRILPKKKAIEAPKAVANQTAILSPSPKRSNKRSVNVFPLASKIMSGKTSSHSQAA